MDFVDTNTGDRKWPSRKVPVDLLRNFFIFKKERKLFMFPKTCTSEIISKCFHIIYHIRSSKWPCKIGVVFVVRILKQRLKETKWLV